MRHKSQDDAIQTKSEIKVIRSRYDVSFFQFLKKRILKYLLNQEYNKLTDDSRIRTYDDRSRQDGAERAEQEGADKLIEPRINGSRSFLISLRVYNEERS